MKHIPVVMLLAVVFLSSCHKTKDGNFTLLVKAKYGDRGFAIATPNTDPLGRRIKIDNLKFYLSHIKLIKADNSEVEVKDVAFFDLGDPNTLAFNVKGVSGDFKSIKFSCGVDSIQNLTDPGSVPSGSALSGDNNMYWAWLKYQFEVLEARADTTTTGAGPFNWYPVYHIGGNSLYRSAQILKTFSVCCDNTTNLNLMLDVKKIFYDSTQTLDIITERSTQSSGSDDPIIAPKFADNFSQAFSIE